MFKTISAALLAATVIAAPALAASADKTTQGKTSAPVTTTAQTPAAKTPAAKPASPAPKAAAAKKGTSAFGVYVKHWGQQGSEAVQALFASAGKILEVRLRRGRYALVFFDNAASVKKAIDSFNGKEINGRKLEVAQAKAALRGDNKADSKVVFVAPIFRQSTSDKQIRDIFGKAGKVTKLRTYRTNYAYVYFDTTAAAQKAVKELNKSTLNNKTLTVKLSSRSRETDKKKAAHAKRVIALLNWKKKQHRSIHA